MFATLDPKLKQLQLPSRRKILLSDTERALCGNGTSGGQTVAVSALTKEGLDQLLAAIDTALVADPLVKAKFRLPQSEGSALAALEAGAVLSEKALRGM